MELEGDKLMLQDVLEFVTQCISEGKTVALVTVTGTADSSPASPGQMMAVLADGTSNGTVGGGSTEHQVIGRAIDAIKNGEVVFNFAYDHNKSGMICGGSMTGFGNVIGRHAGLYIFGGGHVAQSLARIAVLTGFSVTVVEDRQEFAPYFSAARYIVCEPGEYENMVPLQDGGYAIICTRGHKTDDVALRYCLSKNLEYIGMIGSRQKVAELFAALRSEGVSGDELGRVYTPIGLDIASVSPHEIAVAILAEILLLKNRGKLRHKRDA